MHGFECSQIKARHADGIRQAVHIGLGLVPEIVIKSSYHLVRSKGPLPLLQMSSVSIRLRQLGIAEDLLFEIPRDHAISALDPIMREDAFDSVPKYADHFRLGNSPGQMAARRARCEVRRRHLACKSVSGRAPVVSPIPVDSTVVMNVEEPGFLNCVGKYAAFTQNSVQPTRASAGRTHN